MVICVGKGTGERAGEEVRDCVGQRERERHPGVNDWSCAPLLYAPDGVH